MLILVVILVAACVFVEIKIMKGVPSFVRDFFARYRLASLGFSLVLSVFLGTLFGAAGLIVFAAGVVSTVVIQPFYALNKTGKWAELEQKYANAKSKFAENKHVYVRRWEQTVVLGRLSWKVLSAPFKALFWVWDFVEFTSEKFSQKPE